MNKLLPTPKTPPPWITGDAEADAKGLLAKHGDAVGACREVMAWRGRYGFKSKAKIAVYLTAVYWWADRLYHEQRKAAYEAMCKRQQRVKRHRPRVAKLLKWLADNSADIDKRESALLAATAATMLADPHDYEALSDADGALFAALELTSEAMLQHARDLEVSYMQREYRHDQYHKMNQHAVKAARIDQLLSEAV